MENSSSPAVGEVDKGPARKRPGAGLLSRHHRLRWLLILALFLAALSIRMYHIDSSAGEWYEGRQYFSAWGARCIYYSSLESIPDWKEAVVEAYPERNSEMMVPLPSIEGIGFVLYRLAGGEHMWLPRAFSALAWVLGGVFLYLLAKKLMSREAAFLATGFYLFLPWAITGSRSFQAEPLMVAAMIGSIYTIVLHHEKPTVRRALIAAAVAGLAILVRPVCGFMIFGAFAALALNRQGVRRSIADVHSWLFLAAAIVPTIALLIYDRLFIASEGVTYLGESTLQPELLLRLTFYFNWARYAFEVIGSWGLTQLFAFLGGLLTLVAAVVGTVRLRKGYGRALLVGLWCGYVACCVVYSYHISNHHYFHLQLIPLVALGLGPVVHRALRKLTGYIADVVQARWLSRVVVAGIVFMLVAFPVMYTAGGAGRTAETGRERERDAQTIGQLVDHSTTVIALSEGRGYDVAYHGWFFGRMWPHWDMLEVQGVDAVRGEALFNSMCQDWQASHFVITELPELERQADLKEFLFRTYPIVAETEGYLVFDLREPLTPSDGTCDGQDLVGEIVVD